VSLLCEEQDDRLAAVVVADKRTESADFGFAELPVAYGEWRFALVPKSIEILEPEQLGRMTCAALNGTLRLPRVSRHVEQGLLPFVVGTHGLLELAAHEQLGEASVALVRDRMLADFLRLFGRGATTRPSSYDRWVQVHGLTLRTMSFTELGGTSLSRTWVLHESLFPPSIRIVGGVRADDGWLGAYEVLPRVVVPGASSVVLDGLAGRQALTRMDDDWAFPPRDVAGEFGIIASLEDDVKNRRTIRFYVAPANEAFKTPSEPDAWIVEGTNGTVTLSTAIRRRRPGGVL
jgi:hypothetical protein